jgi:hypothetical protein
MVLKMLLTFLAAAIGNGSGAWNIRCIAAGRWGAMTIATLIAGTANMTVIRRVVQDGWQMVPYLVGTLTGFYIVLYFDKKNNCLVKEV